MDAIYYFRFSSNEEFTRKVCPTPENGPSRGNKLEELKKLKELLDMKAITKAEFETEKAKIIVNSQHKNHNSLTTEKSANKLEKIPEVKYEKVKTTFLERNRKVLKGLLIIVITPFVLMFLFTLSAVIYSLFKDDTNDSQESYMSPATHDNGVTIKDQSHPARTLCRKELEKRVKNHNTVKVSIEQEYLVYYPNEKEFIVN